MRFGEKRSTLKTPDQLKEFEQFFIESVEKAEQESEFKAQENEYCHNCQFRSSCPIFGKDPEQLKLI